MHQLTPWHYLLEGTSLTACGKDKQDVFNYTDLTPSVTCAACMKTEEYLAQRMEVALHGPPRTATPEEHGVLDYNSLKKAPVT